jgi:hypothetical protein
MMGWHHPVPTRRPGNSALLPSPLSLSCPSDCPIPLSRRLLHLRKLLVLPARCPPRPRPALVPLTRSPPLLVSVPHVGCANDHLSHRSLPLWRRSACVWGRRGQCWAVHHAGRPENAEGGVQREKETEADSTGRQRARARLEMGSTLPQEGAARQGCEGFAPTAACLWQALLRLGCIAGTLLPLRRAQGRSK